MPNPLPLRSRVKDFLTVNPSFTGDKGALYDA